MGYEYSVLVMRNTQISQTMDIYYSNFIHFSNRGEHVIFRTNVCKIYYNFLNQTTIADFKFAATYVNRDILSIPMIFFI
jgi:hypothetical protein